MSPQETDPAGPFRSRAESSRPGLFRDRPDAGRQLAARVVQYRTEQPIVLALPRGGVPVAFPIAQALDAPLDVLPVRKLGVPGHRELGMGALALGGTSVLNTAMIEQLGISQEALDSVVAKETAELDRQRHRFRDDRPMPDLHDRTVILVDDGLATGVSALAAIHAVHIMAARRVVLAVPVCAPEAADELRPEVDDLVCLACPRDFFAVGVWYQVFGQTSDEEVLDLLEQNRAAQRTRRQGATTTDSTVAG